MASCSLGNGWIWYLLKLHLKLENSIICMQNMEFYQIASIPETETTNLVACHCILNGEKNKMYPKEKKPEESTA
jgi:hypothetical protein